MILEKSSCAGEEQDEGVPGRSMAERASNEGFVRRLLALPLGVGVAERSSWSSASVDDPAAMLYCPRGEGLRCCQRAKREEAWLLSSPPSCSSSVVVVSYDNNDAASKLGVDSLLSSVEGVVVEVDKAEVDVDIGCWPMKEAASATTTRLLARNWTGLTAATAGAVTNRPA